MKMAYQGVALLIAAVIGIGFAAYQYYSQNTPYTHDNQNRSNAYRYIPPPPEETTDNTRKRRKSRTGEIDKCSICQETLMGHVRDLPCMHIFHKDCIQEWFKESRTCPVCRRVV